MLEGRPENKHYICIKDVTTWTPKVLTSIVLVYKCGLRNQFFQAVFGNHGCSVLWDKFTHGHKVIKKKINKIEAKKRQK